MRSTESWGSIVIVVCFASGLGAPHRPEPIERSGERTRVLQLHRLGGIPTKGLLTKGSFRTFYLGTIKYYNEHYKVL